MAVPEQDRAALAIHDERADTEAQGSPVERPASSWNQRSRSAHGTAAFAGDVDGSTKSCVVAERPLLHAEPGPLAERAAICLLADEAEPAGLELARDLLEPLGRAGEVAAPQVARAGRRAVRGVRDADPFLQQLELLRRLVEPRREARRMEQPPEVVARVREVRLRRRGDAARVDAAEDDLEARREDVRDSARRSRR